MSSIDPDTLDAMCKVREAAWELETLIKQARDNGLTAAQRKEILTWIPKQRKVIDEIDAVLKVKTPTMDDELREIMEYPEFSPKRWYVVTMREVPEQVAVLGHPMPLHMSGDQVTEMLYPDDSRLDDTMRAHLARRYSHIYEVQDDGSLALKRVID